MSIDIDQNAQKRYNNKRDIMRGGILVKRFYKLLSIMLSVILTVTLIPLNALAAPTVNQIINAATEIIMVNEGNYTTVVRDDNGALSIGKICWHATNALNLLKDIVALNPSQALEILGASLYNEIVTYSYWETRIPTKAEASAISVLLSTAESRRVQDETAWRYISDYVNHGMKLGITEPEALIFFADFENQNGRGGAASYYYEVMRACGKINLATLYECSSKNSRRTRTYNFCATVNWNNYTDSPSYIEDAQPPDISDVSVSEITSKGYTVSCKTSDNEGVTAVFFAVFYKTDGADTAKWYKVENTANAVFTVNVSEFGGKTGDYSTYIYAFDEAGNYSYVQLNDINVPSAIPVVPPFGLTVSAVKKDGEIKWQASASNGSGNYLYSFVVYRDGVAVSRRAASDFSDFTYYYNQNGSYNAVVTVTDTVSGESVQTTSAKTDIFTPIEVYSFESATKSVMLNESVTWTLNAGGGEGKLKFSYTVYNGDKIVYSSEFSGKNVFLFKPEADGLYNVTATVMDERLQVVTQKSTDVVVIKPLTVQNASFTADYAVAGAVVECKAEVDGGYGNYECVFKVYLDGELLITSPVSDVCEYSFTVEKAGNYSFTVEVTDGEFTATGEAANLKTDLQAAKGDANCDSKVTALDARHALRVSAGLEVQPEALFYAADVNGDGKITAADARLILRYVARLENII